MQTKGNVFEAREPRHQSARLEDHRNMPGFYNRARGGFRNAGDKFKHGRLSSTRGANDARERPVRHGEARINERNVFTVVRLRYAVEGNYIFGIFIQSGIFRHGLIIAATQKS